jgi:hypothetical protein
MLQLDPVQAGSQTQTPAEQSPFNQQSNEVEHEAPPVVAVRLEKDFVDIGNRNRNKNSCDTYNTVMILRCFCLTKTVLSCEQL